MPQPVELPLFSETETGRFPLYDVLRAAHLCLQGKEQTWEACEYVYRWWSECVQLWRELNDGSYAVSRYIVFISHWPVVREIFGSKFRDRVVDTLLMMRVLPVVDAHFVVDNYSTRKNKGALFGIWRVYDMIREESCDYTCDCYILKVDILSFFVSISKEIAYRLWERFLAAHYEGADCWLILATIKTILYDCPEQHCIIKGHISDWQPLPRSKSLLLGSDGRHGLPIGKVVSQVTALLYLDDIDHRLATQWHLHHNGHYMDDRVLVGQSEKLLWQVKRWLDAEHEQLELQTHPRKTTLQHYTKGILFAGAMIMPGRIYVSNRTIGNCFRKLYAFNRRAENEPGYVEQHAQQFAAVMNSYFGLLAHFTEWRMTHRVISSIAPEWYRVMTVVMRHGRYKVELRKAYRPQTTAIRRLKDEMDYYFDNNEDHRRSMRLTA